MCIYNDCKIVIDLNKLVKARPCGVDLADEHVDNIANDLRKRMTFDSLFGQVDTAIWEYAEECQSFGFQIPQYGQIANDAELNRREKAKKEFEMVDLVSPSWTIQVPRRKKK